MATKTQKTINMKLVDKVVSSFKGDEKTLVTKFFEKQQKLHLQAIKDLEQNKAILETAFKVTMDKLGEKLEDAQQELTDAYEAIEAKDIKTNEAINTFGYKYWTNIVNKENTVNAIVKAIEDTEKEKNASDKENNDQIAKYQARIDKIS